MSLISLKTELRQELKLTPQLLQSMEVLQMNSQELLEYLGKLSEENPTLELSDAPDLRSSFAELRQKASWLDAGTFGTTFTHEEGSAMAAGRTGQGAGQPVRLFVRPAGTETAVKAAAGAVQISGGDGG